MSLNNPALRDLDLAIKEQHKSRSLESGLNTALAVLNLLGCKPEQSIEDIQLTKLQLPNSERYDHWFQPHPFFKSNRSCFELVNSEDIPLQAKFFWLQKQSKLAITGGVHFSPNWEDSEFTRAEGYKVGIDFFLTESADALLIVLSDRGNLRIVELSDRLRATQVEIFSTWTELGLVISCELLHGALWKTFQLQAVNEKFYVGISNSFTELVQHINQNLEKFDEETSKQFANRLLGRLLFCWFLRKKQILDETQVYFDVNEYSSTDYYRIKLEPLFFLTLNTRVKDRAEALSELIEKSQQKVKSNLLSDIRVDVYTPYLNGGLFENHESDFFGERVITFPDGFFVRLYEHFDSYNFTTDESSPEYEQVAIDPEMLGKVFESLLATQVDETGEQARQATGAFYTPRNVVSHMCKEAVRGALRIAAGENQQLCAAIDGLLDTSDSQWAFSGSNSKRDILKGHGEKIEKLLMNLKIMDPSCGSGAFPLGMLQLLVKLGERISPKTKPYDLKVHFLGNAIYGVDIEPMAIEISKLRAWLSLIVDEENISEIHTLPNLDFHFVCCNALVPLDDEIQSSISFGTDPSIELDKIRKDYFMESEPKTKKKLQKNYQMIINNLTGYESNRASQLVTFNPFISNFAAGFFDKVKMFGIEEGFDIVIGNPPYIRQERVKYKNELQSYEVFDKKADLYTYFYEMGLRNLRQNGVLSFITSSKFGRTQYGRHLRSFLGLKSEIDYIIDFGDTHVFTAVANTWVVQLRKSIPGPTHKFVVLDAEQCPKLDFTQSELDSEGWAFLRDDLASIKRKITSIGTPLRGHQLSLLYGVKTGCNDAFVVSSEIKDKLVQEDPSNETVLLPILRGRDILQFEVKPATNWLIGVDNSYDVPRQLPSIARYLEGKNIELEFTPEKRVSKGRTWMNIQGNINLSSEDKIVWSKISKFNKFGWSSNSEQILDTAYRMHGSHLKYYLGVLNSKVILFIFHSITNSTGMNTTQWEGFTVERIPVPKFSEVKPKISSEIEMLVEQRIGLSNIISAKECRVIESQIEKLVRDLFELTQAESDAIDEWLIQQGLQSD